MLYRVVIKKRVLVNSQRYYSILRFVLSGGFCNLSVYGTGDSNEVQVLKELCRAQMGSFMRKEDKFGECG